MELDIHCLCGAKIENVERLAHALGVKLPKKKRRDHSAYARELILSVMQGLRRDAEQARRKSRRRAHQDVG